MKFFEKKIIPTRTRLSGVKFHDVERFNAGTLIPRGI